MARAKQLMLFEENRSERLAHIAPVLGAGEVNSDASLTAASRERGVEPSHRGRPQQRQKSFCEGGLRYNESGCARS